MELKNLAPLVVLATTLGCAHSDPWTKQDTILQVGVSAVLALDAVTTADIQYHSNIVEIGPVARPLLGANPSSSDTWTYFATVALSHYLISRALPAKWRPYWQGATILYETRWIINNCSIGLGSMCHEDEHPHDGGK